MAKEKMDEESKAYLADILPVDPRVSTKPMFGSLGSFAGGHMFGGLFGSKVFARLPEEDRTTLLETEGAEEFSPMPGRPMKEYVAFPDSWREDREKAREWMDKAFAWVSTMPPKEPKKKK